MGCYQVGSTRGNNGKLLVAVIAGSGVLTMGALAMAIGQEHAAPSTVTGLDSGMTVGATSTQTTPPTVPETSMAVPAIKGPAKIRADQ